MSGITSIVPNHLLKNSIIGACISVCIYIVLQLISALLIHNEVVSEDAMYPLVCCGAAVSSMIGCSFSASRGGKRGALSVSAVVAVFLSLTLLVGLTAGEAKSVADGMVGIGVAMCAGGLGAVIFVNFVLKKKNKGIKHMKHARKGKRP